MNKFEFYQRMREFVSLFDTMSATGDYNKIRIEMEKMKKLAVENGFNFTEIYNEVRKISNSKIKSDFLNPLTDELCEAILNQILEKGRVEIRQIRTGTYAHRGKNDFDSEYLKAAELKSMNVGLQIFLDNIKLKKYNLLDPIWYKSINEIGIEKLEEYIKSGICDNDKLRLFLEKVFESCYDSNGNDTMIGEQPIHTFDDKEDVYRLYFNMPKNKDTIGFIRDYQILCQQAGITFKMKPFKNMEEVANDTTIFYSSYKDINTRLKIIKELQKKYPNMQLGTPPIACSTIDGIEQVGFCSMGVVIELDKGIYKNYMTYNDYINDLADVALFEIFGNSLSASSTDLSEKYESFKKKNLRNMFSSMICGIGLSNKNHIEKVRRILYTVLSDPLRKKVIIQQLKKTMQKYHNMNQGYPYDYDSNIATDTWYIDKERQKYPEYEVATDTSIKSGKEDNTEVSL